MTTERYLLKYKKILKHRHEGELYHATRHLYYQKKKGMAQSIWWYYKHYPYKGVLSYCKIHWSTEFGETGINCIQVNVFTLNGLSPLCVNMCLWSQLWLVDGVLYTLQPFHRQTNTWGTIRVKQEERRRSLCRHSEQTIQEEKRKRWKVGQRKTTKKGRLLSKQLGRRLLDRKTQRIRMLRLIRHRLLSADTRTQSDWWSHKSVQKSTKHRRQFLHVLLKCQQLTNFLLPISTWIFNVFLV